jgi:hypothetical protein
MSYMPMLFIWSKERLGDMNQQRKRIIISEIKYWKQHKLLPAHFCDFLITLYTQGEDEEDINAKSEDAILVKRKKNLNWTNIWLVLLTAAIGGSMFSLNQYPGITIALAAMLTFGLLFVTLRKKRIHSVGSILYILISFMFLAMSLKLWLVFFEGQSMLLIGLLMLNCVLWIFAGRRLQLLFFTISGVAGLLLIFGFLLRLF